MSNGIFWDHFTSTKSPIHLFGSKQSFSKVLKYIFPHIQVHPVGMCLWWLSERVSKGEGGNAQIMSSVREGEERLLKI